jgi:ADP-heptose:LPS heptosyltransferase
VRDPARILLVRLSHLGDVVSALGVFHALHAAYPRAEIAWAVEAEFAGILRGIPGLSRTILFRRHGGLAAWRELGAELAAFAPDLAVDAQGNFKSALTCALSRAPRRAGLARADWREPLASLVLNEPAPEALGAGSHVLDRMRALARHVAPAGAEPWRTDPALSPVELERGRQLLERYRPAPAARTLLHVGRPDDVRSLPAAGWVALARALRARGAGVLVLSGPGEAALGREIAGVVGEDPGLRHWIGQEGARELAAVFTLAGREGWKLVVGDSGPMRLACACGLPSVVLEGPQDAARTGPWPADGPHRVVLSAEPPACAPCLARRCDHPQGPVCMSSIATERILTALDGAGSAA